MSAIQISKLSITTPNDLEIALTRSFDAPRALVWEAYTTPEHVQRWWGCDQSKLGLCEIDLREGGAWRYGLQMNDGTEFRFNGVYQQVDAPERLVYTQVFEPMPQHSMLVTVTFEEENGITTLREVVRHDSVETRDGHLHSGMPEGAAQTFDRLETLLSALS